MKFLFPSSLKRESLCQRIVQASRPRSSMMPIPFGIGVEVDKTMGSKWLINHLHRLGFSISYDEVTRFQQAAIENMDRVQETNQKPQHETPFAQWIAGSVDNNIATLSGKGTFHGLKMISSNSKPTRKFGAIPRLKKKLATSFAGRGVETISYNKVPTLGLSKIKLLSVKQMVSSPSKSAIET